MSNKPEVTLLKAEDYVLYLGDGKTSHFKRGKPRNVNPSLAARLKKLRTKKGEPLFRVRGDVTVIPDEQNVRGDLQLDLPV